MIRRIRRQLSSALPLPTQLHAYDRFPYRPNLSVFCGQERCAFGGNIGIRLDPLDLMVYSGNASNVSTASKRQRGMRMIPGYLRVAELDFKAFRLRYAIHAPSTVAESPPRPMPSDMIVSELGMRAEGSLFESGMKPVLCELSLFCEIDLE